MAELHRVEINEKAPSEIEPVDEKVETPEVQQEEPQAEEKQERPEWLPEKFKSPEDLAQAYSELEKQYHSKGEETTEQSVDEDPVPAEYVNSTIQRAPDEYAELGHLSEETFKALEASGLSRDLVERYINGVEASSQQQTESLMSEVGGEANYQAMSEWASTALTEDEQDVFNATVESGDTNAALMAIRGLYARYSSDGGKALNLYQGDTVGAGVTPFTSTAQVTEAMQDARYGKDPAYRAHIEKRLSVSSII